MSNTANSQFRAVCQELGMDESQTRACHEDLNDNLNEGTTDTMAYQQLRGLCKEWMQQFGGNYKDNPKRGGGRTGGGESFESQARQAMKQRGEDKWYPR